MMPRVWQRLLPPYPAGVVGGFGVLALAAALFMQTHLGLMPCPMCILQRYCLISVIALCFGSALTDGKSGRWLLALAGAAALAGAGLAARQVYLQLAPQVSQGCGPGLEYIVNSFPVSEMLPLLLKGTGDCSQVDWSWHGITVSRLSAVAFLGLLVLVLSAMRARPGIAKAVQTRNEGT